MDPENRYSRIDNREKPSHPVKRHLGETPQDQPFELEAGVGY